MLSFFKTKCEQCESVEEILETFRAERLQIFLIVIMPTMATNDREKKSEKLPLRNSESENEKYTFAKHFWNRCTNSIFNHKTTFYSRSLWDCNGSSLALTDD